MRYHAALLLLVSLAAASAADDKTANHNPSPTTKPEPKPTSKPEPKPTTKPGSPGTTPKGGGKGDPIMQGFDGRSFEFMGRAGSTYNVLSEKTHQLSMKLKEGHMWDHEGTYMDGLGFRYQDHDVIVQNEGDSMTVTLDGEQLAIRKDETEVEHILGLASGELQLLWQLHRPELGNALEITSELVKVLVWVTPAGTRDEGNKVQPAYLNFDISLLSSPAHNAMEGIIGETFGMVLANEVQEDDFKFHGEEAKYEMASFFDTAHPKCLLGRVGSVNKARKLISSGASFTFPLSAALS